MSTFVAVIILVLFVTALALVRVVQKQHDRIADLQVAYDVANAELEVAKVSYKALMATADTLARERSAANSLVREVGVYVGKMGAQVKELLANYASARRALERIATFQRDVEGANYTQTLMGIANDAIAPLGLTATGTVDAVAAALASDPLPAELAGKNIDNFVVDDNRKTRVDLSGQAARIRVQLKDTVGRLQSQFGRPVNTALADPLVVAADRLENKNLAVDLVKHEGQATPSLAIIVEGREDDIHAAAPKSNQADLAAETSDGVGYGTFLSPKD